VRGPGDDSMTRSVPQWAQRARSAWRYRGQSRPPFAAVPGPGQESVWDYPRPPRLEPDVREVIVTVGAQEVARSKRTVRLLETASPPTFYVPPDDVRTELLQRGAVSSRCEWKGEADYWAVVVGGRPIDGAAWWYAGPLPGYASTRAWLPARSTRCRLSLSPAGFMVGGSRLNLSGRSRVNRDPKTGDR
jgi:uncharacterized protein (DUF427 family)